MTTLSELVDQCEDDLGDPSNATWTAADITQWCRDAIADYGLHFPLVSTQSITTSLNDRSYDLNGDFLAAVSVEYPTGEDPPEYLERRDYQQPGFWHVDGYYDIVKRDSAGDTDELWISEKPAASETITVIYQAAHDNGIGAGESITVQAEHQHILRKYVIWQALVQLKHVEEANPTSNSSLLMSQLAVNVDRARRAYVDSLAKAVFAESRSRPVSWSGSTEEMGRIY